MRITHVDSSSKRAMGTLSSRKSKIVGSNVAPKRDGPVNVNFVTCQTAPQDFVAIHVEQDRLSADFQILWNMRTVCSICSHKTSELQVL